MKQTDSSCSAFLPTATVRWSDDNTPESEQFEDIYFSRADGLGESRHVFIEHNQLPRRFASLAQQGRMIIGETGFGTGLNFLLSWACFDQHAPASARLIFRSVEAHPLAGADLERALAHWPELGSRARELIARWPVALPGLHCLDFAQGRVQLHLWLGDVADGLAAWRDSDSAACQREATRADAWFLDGFAPARNPAMWREEVLGHIASLSRPGTTLATFTAAGQIRRGLSAVGFAVEKRAGFGRKREMLCARFGGLVGEAAPHADTPWHYVADPAPRQRTAVVIGAGIAGCTTARALAQRGYGVQVIEAAAGPACGASGNPQAVLFTPLPQSDAPAGQIQLHAYLYATRFYRALAERNPQCFRACGLLQLLDETESGDNRRLIERFGGCDAFARFLGHREASEQAGLRLSGGAVLLPQSGWVSPAHCCAELLRSEAIDLRTHTTVNTLQQHGTHWRLDLSDGSVLETSLVIIAAANGVRDLVDGVGTCIDPLRGQISALPASMLAGGPRCVVCGEGYITPSHDGECWFGASYTRNSEFTDIRPAEHADNLLRLQTLLPDVSALPEAVSDGRAALRCTSRDRLPLIGPVARQPAFDQHYSALSKNARQAVPGAPPVYDGLFLNIGHGSRGFTTAPFAAEYLAGLICAEPPLLPWSLQQYLLPTRFDIRRLRRTNRTRS